MPICFSPRLSLFAIAALLFITSVPSQAMPAPCSLAAKDIPGRGPQMQGSTAFLEKIADMDEPQRDRAIRTELLAGNLPQFLRNMQAVSLRARLHSGKLVRLTLCVMPDYLSIGSDEDFLLVPMGLSTALFVAAQFGFTLPTRHMVDLIYHGSGLQLAPQPLPASAAMRSTDYYRRHDALVKQQRATSHAALDVLTAGHKKDLVLSPRLLIQPGRVAIYGWHRAEGKPIQPLSTVHGARYADYSHGVRLVSNTVFVDAVPRSIFEVLADHELSPLLSDEGAFPNMAEWVDQASAEQPGI